MPEKPNFAIRIELTAPYEAALQRTKQALKEQGFGVLTEIDVKETLQKKLGAECRKYVILGACNPPLAHRALQHELEIGLLLPCNVIVYEKSDGGSVVSMMDPEAMISITQTPALKAVAGEARARLEKVAQALQEP